MTIEERAKESCIKNRGEIQPIHEAAAYIWGYCDGATEQQKIDIEKACDWLKDNGCFSYLQEGSQTLEDVEIMFRKAMEE